MIPSHSNLLNRFSNQYNNIDTITTLEDLVDTYFRVEEEQSFFLSCQKPQHVIVFCDGVGRDSLTTLTKFFQNSLPKHLWKYLEHSFIFGMHSDTGCEFYHTYAIHPYVIEYINQHRFPYVVLRKGTPYHRYQALDYDFRGMKKAGIPTRQRRGCTHRHKIIPMRFFLSLFTQRLFNLNNQKWSYKVRKGILHPHIFLIGINFSEAYRTYYHTTYRAFVKTVLNNGYLFDEFTLHELKELSYSRKRPLEEQDLVYIIDHRDRVMQGLPVPNDTVFSMNAFLLTSAKITHEECVRTCKEDCPVQGMLPSGCFCCPFMSIKDYYAIMILYPELWERTVTMEALALEHNPKLKLVNTTSKLRNITEEVHHWECKNQWVREDPLKAAQQILLEAQSIDRAI